LTAAKESEPGHNSLCGTELLFPASSSAKDGGRVFSARAVFCLPQCTSTVHQG